VRGTVHRHQPGSENDGLSPEFAEKIKAAGLKANVYSFNTVEQMEKYFGPGEGKKASPLPDGMITNRTDLTVDFYHARKVRSYGTEKTRRRPLLTLDITSKKVIACQISKKYYVLFLLRQ
jgi:hypothetical protein